MTGGVLHGIIGPRRQLVFTAVGCPGEAGTVGRHLETKSGIGDDIDPRHRRRLSGTERHDILTAIVGETAQAVKEFEIGRAHRGRGVCDFLAAMPGQPPGQGRFATRVELAGQAAVLRIEDDASDREQQRSRCVGDQVGAQHINRAGGTLAELRARLTTADQTFKGALQILDVRRATLVDDDHVKGETLHPPIIGRLHEVAGDTEMLDVGDAQQNDRQVPGNPQRPQSRLRAGPRCDRFRRRTQARRYIKHATREALELTGIASAQP